MRCQWLMAPARLWRARPWAAVTPPQLSRATDEVTILRLMHDHPFRVTLCTIHIMSVHPAQSSSASPGAIEWKALCLQVFLLFE